ncbi:MAG: glutamate-5-semialdehyde dehydrogenase [Candidatus Margulisiibacteriota bacterium]|jgi:glutamate-5-semialdehyde dehydrogenase
MQKIVEQCAKAYQASLTLTNISGQEKNQALQKMAELVLIHKNSILTENAKDIKNAKASGLSNSLIDRMTLNETRLKEIAESLLIIKDITDPIGEIIHGWQNPAGFSITKIRVPLGVIGIIYEARPNVTADAIGLCLKSGNAVVLRGSSSTYNSNKALADILRLALKETNISEDIIQLLEDTSRENIKDFLTQNQYLSVIIPRGGADLIKTVVANATVPTIETGVGNCHIYVDQSANLNWAKDIIINAKTQRPSVCNACETILVHQEIAGPFLKEILPDLLKLNVELRACEKTLAIFPNLKKANSLDWETEYLDLILAVKIVTNLDEAISHIQKYSTHHSEAIIADNHQAIDRFKKAIDAAAVLINASTRLTDGGVFGFGAEMGISTQKMHARGPMGLKELTAYKYIIEGQGSIRK